MRHALGQTGVVVREHWPPARDRAAREPAVGRELEADDPFQGAVDGRAPEDVALAVEQEAVDRLGVE